MVSYREMPKKGGVNDSDMFDNPVAETFETDGASFDTDDDQTKNDAQTSPRSRQSAAQKREAKRKAKAEAEALKNISEFTMEGNSLGAFGPENPVRALFFAITNNAVFESFILLLIMFAPVVLILQMPAYVEELSDDTVQLIAVADIVTLSIFTLEAVTKIVALGFIKGNSTYLRNAWNRLDFFLVCSTWLSIIIGQETPLFKLFRAMRALRPLRKLRLMTGLAAILEFYPYILNVCGFLLFFFSMFGTIGIQLFGGSTSYICSNHGEVTEGSGIYWTNGTLECPPTLPNCPGKCEKATMSYADYPDDRIHEVHLVGFDNILQAWLTEFVVTTLDEWPAISHPMIDVGGPSDWLVWPFFLLMVLVLSVITANLFVSIICYAFGNVSESEDAESIEARVKKLRALFERIDTDGSGEIAPSEIVKIAEMVGVDMNDAEIASTVEEMDYDGSGVIDFEEFCEWWKSPSPIASRIRRAVVHEEALIHASFDKIDTDNSGSLNPDEIGKMAYQMGISLTEQELDACLEEMDGDGSKEIDFNEFTAWWFSGSTTAAKVGKAAKGEEAKMKALFGKLDRDNSGKLDISDFVENGGAAFGTALSRPEAEKIIKEMSGATETDGVGLTEFMAWWASDMETAVRVRTEQQEDEARARMMFDNIDSDGSGRLQASEFVLMSKQLKIPMTLEEADELVATIDSGMDSEVEFPEFYVWLCEESDRAIRIRKKLKTYLDEKAKPAFPYIPGCSDLFRSIVTTNTFELVIMGVVVTNTVIMATEHHEQPEDLTKFVRASEFVFTLIYVSEAIMKIFGIGALPYFREPLNQLDFLICVSSVAGLFLKDFSALASFRIIRLIVKLMRVMRMIKVLAKYDAVVLLLKTVIGSSGLLGSLSFFIFFILGLFALIGGHILGVCHLPKAEGEEVTGFEHGQPDFPRSNFYYFGTGIITNFQIMSGEDWAPVMYSYMNCAGNWAALYFISMVLLTNFFLLNIFVAVILENFELSEEEKFVKQERKHIELNMPHESLEEQGKFVVNWLKKRKGKKKRTFDENGEEIISMDTSVDVPPPSARKVAKVMRKGLMIDDVTREHKADRDEPMADRQTAEEIEAEEAAAIEADMHWNMTHAQGLEGADVSLHCFSVDNGVRKCCQAITGNKHFDELVLLVIIVCCLLLALEGPPDNDKLDDEVKLVLTVGNWFVFVFFWIECIIKIVADGFMFTPNGYIMDDWNRLDFFVVIVSTVDVILSLLGQAEWVSSLRLLRVLRPLRILKHNEGMRVVMDAIVQCIPTVSAVVALSGLFYVTFAILGVGLFSGRFFRCDCGGSWGLPVLNCTHADPESLDREDCIAQGGLWRNPPYNFDNVLNAIRTLFICSTTEGWIDIMYSGMDVTEVYKAPVRDAAFENFAFFAVFIIFGSFFVTNIFIGVLVNVFGESSGSALLTERQKEWLQTQLLCMTVRSRNPIVPESGPRQIVHKVVFSSWFDIFISISIIINVGCLMIEHVGMEEDLAESLALANLVFLVIFTLEMILRVLAMGPREYFSDSWLCLDFFIVATSWLTVFFKSYSGFQAVRALRVLRLLMLLKNAQTLRSLFSTMLLSLPPAANLCCLLFLVFFVFAVAGMQLYGNMPHSQMINSNDNFDNIVNAMCLLFQVSTGQDFMNIVYEMENQGKALVFPFFCCFIICSIWVFFNLFVAVLLENFENNFTAAEMELSMWHIAHYKEMWCSVTPAPAHERMAVQELRSIVPRLHDPLSRITKQDENWFNRVLFEMDIDLTADLSEVNVKFHETLLALCLVYQSYDGLSFEEQQKKRERIQRCKEKHALKVLAWCTRVWYMMRHPPAQYKTEEQKAAYRSAIGAIRLLLLDSMVRTGKVIRVTVGA